jgi:hypothetical protein
MYSGGVSAIDTPTMAIRCPRNAASIKPKRNASPNTTKANSPPSASTLASMIESRIGNPPAVRPISVSSRNFAPIRISTPNITNHGSAITACTSMVMPMAMKNRPSSKPSKGLICASSSWRNSESASSTPARNAPRPIVSPASCMIHAAPSTTSNALAVNTSGISVRATMRNICRSNNRPPTITPAIAATALTIAIHDTPSPRAPPSSGIAASKGIAARSWNNRIAKANRPYPVVNALRSASNCRPTAVEENASDNPTTVAAPHSSPRENPSSDRAMPQVNICRPPAPNTGLRITCKREGESSRPMTKSSITTPISLAANTGSTLRITRKPYGPSTTPAARYPSTAPRPKRRNTGTAMTAASRKTSASSNPPPCMCTSVRGIM